MFARNQRYSFKNGAPKKIYSSPLFVIRYDRNEEQKLECAVVVGKKVDKRAVVRNKLKRQVVSLIKELILPETPVKLVIFAKKPLNGVSNEEKREELLKTLKTIQII